MSAFQDSRKQSFKVEPIAPILPLYPYQRAVIEDNCRLKGMVKSRQIGGTTLGTLDMAIDAATHASDWNAMSRTGRQSKRLLRKTAKHIQAIDRILFDRFNCGSLLEKEPSSEEIVFKNGAIISAVPCDPDTTVGDTVHWFLDEVGLYLTDSVFGIIKPSTMHGKRIFMASTPRGRRGKFADLYQKWKELGQEQTGWSFHVITIEDAMNGGMPLFDHQGNQITFEQFKRQEISDIGLQMWLQEYMCVFQDAISAFLSWASIERCATATPMFITPFAVAEMVRSGRRLFAGYDVGRHTDLSVFWLLELMLDGTVHTRCVRSFFDTIFDSQKGFLREYLLAGIEKLHVDNVGIGMNLAENLKLEFPGQVEQINFTNANKFSMAERVRTAIDTGTFRYPSPESTDADDEIAEDFASIERITTEHGNVRIEAVRGNKTHGDYFWAAALAMNATAQVGTNEIAMASA